MVEEEVGESRVGAGQIPGRSSTIVRTNRLPCTLAIIELGCNFRDATNRRSNFWGSSRQGIQKALAFGETQS